MTEKIAKLTVCAFKNNSDESAARRQKYSYSIYNATRKL